MTATPPSAVAPSTSRPLALYLVAAEESGDQLGAALIGALRARHDGELALSGVGGHAMAAAGVVSPFAIHDLSIVGLAAIPRRLPMIFRRIRETADAVVAARPDALIIIDSPDFTHRVARRVRRQLPSIPIVDYVAPTVWAWRPGRARAMRAYVDHVLAILPFEPAIHAQLGGPPCSYVGHPLVERTAELRPNVEETRRRNANPPVVLVLPGSRASEVRRHIAPFGAAIAQVANQAEPIELILPTVPQMEVQVRQATAEWTVKPHIVVDQAEKHAAFRIARAALAVSGTITLELALAGVPLVGAYRISAVEMMFARWLVKAAPGVVSSVLLANLVLGERVAPEFLQRDCTPDRLAAALLPLLAETPERQRQIDTFARLDAIMQIGGIAPSAAAAGVVLDVARRGRQPAALPGPAPKREPSP